MLSDRSINTTMKQSKNISDKAIDLCFRYRWVLALLVFLFCVCFRLHGSSIACYEKYFPTKLIEERSTVLGRPRLIRTDEYGVETMKFFSQRYNVFRLFSRQMSLSPTNMVLDYYSPVWNILAVGKPLSWGFLLFGNEVGLSWYWCGMIILMFMLSLETCLILTMGHRRSSLLGAVLVTLSPEIQWWVMPHMPIVILYAMALFTVGYWFFTAKTGWGKWFAVPLAVISVTGFALSIFPSFQVSCAYVVLFLLVFCLYRDRERMTFLRKDRWRLAVSVLAVACILGYFVWVSWNDLDLLLHTSYPGQRVSTGGNWKIRDLFPDLRSLFFPYRDTSYSNNCELSTYIHFAPFFLLLFPKMISYLRRNGDRKSAVVGKVLTGILLVQVVYMLVGIPRSLAKLTFLSYCNRMDGVYGWVAVLYTVWGFSVLLRHPDLLKTREKVLFPLLYGAACALMVDDLTYFYKVGYWFFSKLPVPVDSLPVALLVLAVSIALLTGILLLLTFRRKRLLSLLVVAIMVFAGATVNPLEKGIGAVTNHPVSKSISEISAEEPEATWLCPGCPFPISNFVLANGARVLDATNFYPDMEKLSILDPLQTYDWETNRYANQTSVLTNAETSVTLIAADQYQWVLNPESVKALGVTYLFTPVDYSALLADYGIECRYVTGQDGFGVYRLRYDV